MVRGVRLYLDATRSALADQMEVASQQFNELIALWESVAFMDDLTCVRATFAMLVGHDDPAAAKAAQDAYDWLAETGTHSYMTVYAEGLPAVAHPRAAAR